MRETCASLESTQEYHKNSLPSPVLDIVISYLGLKELGFCNCVDHAWHEYISSDLVWKELFYSKLGVEKSVDPIVFFSKGLRYQKGFQEIFTKFVMGQSFLERYLGRVEARSIPENLLRRWGEKDPFQDKETIGQNYYLLRIDSYVEREDLLEYELKESPNPFEASKVVLKEVGFVTGWMKKIGLIKKTTPQALKIPITIHNLHQLGQNLREGSSFKYTYIAREIVSLYGDKGIENQFVLMRKEVIGRGLSFEEQKKLAFDKNMLVIGLLERIYFNLLLHAKTGVYPDGRELFTLARTSTLIEDDEGELISLGCGGGSFSGLNVHSCHLDREGIGVSVGLA